MWKIIGSHLGANGIGSHEITYVLQLTWVYNRLLTPNLLLLLHCIIDCFSEDSLLLPFSKGWIIYIKIIQTSYSQWQPTTVNNICWRLELNVRMTESVQTVRVRITESNHLDTMAFQTSYCARCYYTLWICYRFLKKTVGPYCWGYPNYWIYVYLIVRIARIS